MYKSTVTDIIEDWAKTKDNQKIANQITKRIFCDVFRLLDFVCAVCDGETEMIGEELNKQYEEELILELAGLD